jgi:hypothetical protein
VCSNHPDKEGAEFTSPSGPIERVVVLDRFTLILHCVSLLRSAVRDCTVSSIVSSIKNISSRYARHLGIPNLLRIDIRSHLGDGYEEEEERVRLGVRREEEGGEID